MHIHQLTQSPPHSTNHSVTHPSLTNLLKLIISFSLLLSLYFLFSLTHSHTFLIASLSLTLSHALSLVSHSFANEEGERGSRGWSSANLIFWINLFRYLWLKPWIILFQTVFFDEKFYSPNSWQEIWVIKYLGLDSKLRKEGLRFSINFSKNGYFQSYSLKLIKMIKKLLCDTKQTLEPMKSSLSGFN